MEQIETDVCVIGAGSGGLSVAYAASQMGARTVLIERGRMGGDCLNYGCVPSKALIASAKATWGQAHSGVFGIASVTPQIDYAAIKDHIAGVIGAIAPIDSQERYESLGVRVIREHARFVSDRELQAGEVRIRARRFVVAAGSSPLVPPIPGLNETPYLTNETIFDLREKPEHLIVVGGGPIGVELAQAHVRLGCKVTLIEGAKALGKDDPELSVIVLDRLRDEGVDLREGSEVSRVSGSAGAVEVETKDGRKVGGTHLLMAVGRSANVDGLDLEKAGVKFGRKGLEVGDDLRTTNRRIYAVGDIAGRMQFTHVAGYHAGVVVRPILLGVRARATQDHLPWVTYADPELAQVGLTEEQARGTYGDRLTVVRFRYAENDRAQAERRTTGLIKVMVVRGRPVGASIVGASAGELIGTWSLAIANKLKMRAISNMVAPYPTLSEINKRAAGAYFSPALFDNPRLKRAVRLVQRLLP
ncbi:dihydrolipoyl dehydrogenase family protein [Roseitranquillus sediminis]|uniref:dihydrolipoyl dehydrogenase family protein n=1 Tax=Roseitranquillus sediminis TaxID=2809051 RepID=UPI001D0C834D|nr:FAD-dependent oxidoreductase [Roseitranquillus sediminis]MBM9596442.1 FAD-dependent oxidoreductase [Roseitranquillus sediminis]